jgi:hypothetical protein
MLRMDGGQPSKLMIRVGVVASETSVTSEPRVSPACLDGRLRGHDGLGGGVVARRDRSNIFSVSTAEQVG